MHAIARLSAVSALFVVMIAGTAQSAIIYSQPSDFPSTYNALTSQSQASGGSYQAYDNFTLASAATLSAVTFQGLYWNPNGPTFNPPALPSPQNLQVGIFTSVNNLPGTLVGQSTLTNLQSAKVGNSVFGPDKTGQNDNVAIYNFAGNLATTIMLSGSTEYWLSFVSFASPAPPLWLWTSGSGGDGKSAQRLYATNSISYVTRDRAFSLSSTALTGSLLGDPGPSDPPSGTLADVRAVPAPATLTLTLMGLGTVGLLRLARRRR